MKWNRQGAGIRRMMIALLAALLLGGCQGGQPEPALQFEDPWVRAMPPGMKMTAAFGHLHNRGDEAIEITGFASPSFADVSLHRSEQVDGVSRMREVSRLLLQPGESRLLEPGGYHLMLMVPTGDPVPEQSVVIEIEAGEGAAYTFEVPWRRR
jgi:copper(I)-binding protein